MEDNIQSNSKEKLISGIKKTVAQIKPTYGPGGSNVVIEEQLPPFYRVTNDGKLIIDAVKLKDHVEQIGKNILAESTDRAEKDSGDGRKTTCLLTEAILTEGLNLKDRPMDIARSLNDCIPHVFTKIDENKKDITVNDVKQVATISSENEEIGTLIQEIYKEIGKDGIIELDFSNLPDTFYTLTDGVRIRSGYFGKYSCTDEEKAIFKNPKILISREKVVSVDQLNPVLEMLKKNGIEELVMYVEDIDMSVASRLAMTHMTGGFKTLVVKAPVLWKDWIYEDFAQLVGATIIDSRNGKTFKNFLFEDFGTCSKVISTETETRLIGTKDISKHIEVLKDKSLRDDQQKVRISWLQTKVAVLKIGGNSETEVGYKIKKAKDACSASYHALREGVVKGGGITLFNMADTMPDTIGGRILSKALKVPYNQICDNMNQKIEVSDEVIDAVVVVKNAVKNAISIAGTNLTANTVLTIPKVEQLQPKFPIMQ